MDSQELGVNPTVLLGLVIALVALLYFLFFKKSKHEATDEQSNNESSKFCRVYLGGVSVRLILFTCSFTFVLFAANSSLTANKQPNRKQKKHAYITKSSKKSFMHDHLLTTLKAIIICSN